MTDLKVHPSQMQSATVQRFWAKVDKTDGCWLWSGSRTSAGYGNIAYTVDGVRHWALAHRLVFLLTTGEAVPADMEVDHLCRVRACVRPDLAHCEIVTPAENKRRMIPFRAPPTRPSTCERGHPWVDGDFSTSREGWRTCLICRRALDRGRSEEQRAARSARRREARAAGRNW